MELIDEPLAGRSCRSCILGVKLPAGIISRYQKQLNPAWKVVTENGVDKLRRRWPFKNFKESKAFVDKISETAEAEGHHPDVTFSFDYVEVKLYTHKAGGLAEEDFILAAKIDTLGESAAR